jgi:hypothetical protein
MKDLKQETAPMVYHLNPILFGVDQIEYKDELVKYKSQSISQPLEVVQIPTHQQAWESS